MANWGIFLDHIPNNVVNWVTTRNYGFSDAADLFIFISGYTVAFVFARMMLDVGYRRRVEAAEACLAVYVAPRLPFRALPRRNRISRAEVWQPGFHR